LKPQAIVGESRVHGTIIFEPSAFCDVWSGRTRILFGQIGAGQWLRYLVGVAELAGVVGLLVPRLAVAAASIAAGMAGVTVINAAICTVARS
jgi:hypothetical protein